MGSPPGLARGVPVCGPKVIPYASGKRCTVRERRLLQTRNQVQREGPERERSLAAAGTAAFPGPGLTRKFAPRALHQAPGSAPSLCPPSLAPRQLFCAPGESLQSHSLWSLSRDAGGSSSEASELRVQASRS